MFTFRIIPDDGESYDLTVTSRDVVKWEKIDHTHTISRLEASPSITDLYSVTHVAAKRKGLFRGVLAEWETSVDLEPLADPAASDPTPPGA
ncbi:MAG: hypothetical protein ACRDTZ_06350 [Pseudonocardiaceae bacterium]